MKKPRVYIAGPITGMKNNNRVAFAAAKERLNEAGYDAVNHQENEDETRPGWTYEAIMKDDIINLMDCQYIYLLPGWDKSRGATLEKHVADVLGIRQVKL